tara:strand:+ start:530 stop:847 length:318 start_codon:yes stop_codon:yes gene_type:complete
MGRSRSRSASQKTKKRLPEALQEFFDLKEEALRTGATTFKYKGKTFRKTMRSKKGKKLNFPVFRTVFKRAPSYKGKKKTKSGVKGFRKRARAHIGRSKSRGKSKK